MNGIKRWFLLPIVPLLIGVAFIYMHRASTDTLKIWFLDIGQGDAIYIRTPSGHDMLIDGGPSVSVLRRLSEIMPFYDQSIDFVLETHPDADHIGGLPAVFERYKVGMFIEPGNESTNRIDDEIRRIRGEKGIVSMLARRGERIDFGDGVSFEILFPDRDVSKFETNDASMVGKLSFGGTAVMLTGDAPKATENIILGYGTTTLKSDILKAGHHGSKTSSGEAFVRAVAPSIAVISAGKDNRYHHPSPETVDLFKRLGIPALITFEVGTIEFESDGNSFKRD